MLLKKVKRIEMSLISEDKLKLLTDAQRIEKLEIEVRRMQVIHIIHFSFIVLAFLGVTAGLTSKLNGLKAKL